MGGKETDLPYRIPMNIDGIRKQTVIIRQIEQSYLLK